MHYIEPEIKWHIYGEKCLVCGFHTKFLSKSIKIFSTQFIATVSDA